MITSENLRASIKAYRAKHGSRRISEELKQEAVGLLRESGKSVSGLAREIGVSDGSLTKWLRQGDEPARFRKLTTATLTETQQWLVEAPGGIRVHCQCVRQVVELIKHLGGSSC
jgi:transposase-like protein